MSHDPGSAAELQDVAARVIAATAYFKSAGHLPAWAQAEIEQQAARDAARAAQRPAAPAARRA